MTDLFKSWASQWGTLDVARVGDKLSKNVLHKPKKLKGRMIQVAKNIPMFMMKQAANLFPKKKKSINPFCKFARSMITPTAFLIISLNSY